MTHRAKTLKTRFAPSPTGDLHLGHVAHMIWTWGVAKLLGAAVQYRVEDHDLTRCTRELEARLTTDLGWLGFLGPNEPPVWRQSDRGSRYREVLDSLVGRNLVYACICSRKDVATAQEQTNGEQCYPGTCRKKSLPLDTPGSSLRVILPATSFCGIDLIKGELLQSPFEQCGDVAIRDRHGHWTYQFCVVIDDIDGEIDIVIRGIDLITSVGRQLALRSLIAPHVPTPIFLHHPLILDEAGQKLSKRNRSTGIVHLREDRKTAEDVIGLAAASCGLQTTASPLSAWDVVKLMPEHVRRKAEGYLHGRT